MLKEVRFKNWKSFGEASLYIDPLTVLIGTNASGKSNVLDGLDFLSKFVKGKSLEEIFQEIRGGAEWAFLKPNQEFTIEVVVGKDDTEDYRYSVTVSNSPHLRVCDESLTYITYQDDSRTTENKIFHRVDYTEEMGRFSYLGKAKENFSDILSSLDDPEVEMQRNLFNELKYILDKLEESNLLKDTPEERARLRGMLNEGVAHLNKLDELKNELGINRLKLSHDATITVIREISGIFILDPIPSLMRNYSSFSSHLSRNASNLAGVLVALPENEKVQVEQTLSHYVSQLPEREIRKVWAEPVGRLSKDAMLYCEEEWVKEKDSTLIDASGMSDGTLRFLAILTALLTRPEGSQIIIEEVDNGLHPSRAGLLLNMLREIGSKRKIDVLVTTHNPALLNALGPEMVPFVVVAHRSPETGASNLTLLENIDNLPKLLASGPLGKIVSTGDIEKSLAEEMDASQ